MIIHHQFVNQNHFFPPWKIDVLVLGTFNPECGEKTDYFYGRSRNNFWRSIEEVANVDNYFLQDDFEEKIKLMTLCKFGCTDIIKSLTVEKEKEELICGKGYSDSVLFNQSITTLNYQFEEIKEYILNKQVSKIIHTWGKSKKPKIFRDEIADLKVFCKRQNKEFIEDCPSPSGRLRGNEHFEALKDFYNHHIPLLKRYKTLS